MQATEQRYSAYRLADADIAVVAYGSTARICRRAVDQVRSEGINAGLLRPITLWPFPVTAFQEQIPNVTKLLVVEMSEGQMIEDVRLALDCRLPVHFYGRSGGVVPAPSEIADKLRTLASGRERSGGKASGSASLPGGDGVE
jgi:2-oxoglutarate/2-oxoacid ferredoxin oxidoreductase subunit alpha